jgi:hypothetical protein
MIALVSHQDVFVCKGWKETHVSEYVGYLLVPL